MDIHVAYVGFISAFLVFTEVRNYFERKQLLDRIMSRDFTDFTSNEVHKRVASVKLPREENIPL